MEVHVSGSILALDARFPYRTRCFRPVLCCLHALFRTAGGPPPGPALSLSAGGATLIRRDRSAVLAGEDVKAVDRHAFDTANRRPLRRPQRCRRRPERRFPGFGKRAPETSNVWKTDALRLPTSGSFPTATRLRRGSGGQARVREDAPRSPGEGAGGGAGNLRRRAGASRLARCGVIAPAYGVALVGGVRWFPLVVWLVFRHRISRRSSRFTVGAKNRRYAGNP